MKYATNSRTPLIARNFVRAWHDHIHALENDPLGYLDSLINELRRVSPELPIETTKRRLYQMVPTLKLGTAGRLLDCKFEMSEFGPAC